ncbi:acetyl-CoA C-acetyltransferase [Pseudonocardia nematodicida]|uniref:Probable acetyl-CoA acetyltransferase n=1 Tax=Pseudonocardia nematodicida TaxID=1206997 RepID=A0ABV1K8E1_9PSEU
MSREVLVCEPLRTPIGRFGGALATVPAVDLGVRVVRELISRVGIAPERVDDVILGQCYASGENPAIGRIVALDAGLPVSTPGAQVDRRCGSGLQSVVNAVLQVGSGAGDAVIAGGAESMSQVEYYATGMRFGSPGATVELHDRLARARQTPGGRDHPVEGGMLETAENVRRIHAIPREEQDALALRSHRRAVEAHDAGLFVDELVPVEVTTRKESVLVDRDEHPRPDTTAESLARLKPVRRGVDADATVTAGNSSGQNDGAAACLVATRSVAAGLNVGVAARMVSWGVAGVQPELMGLGPVPAVEAALRRADLTMADMDLVELNEAFAAQVLGCTREWKFGEADHDRLNVRGSGISLGHPVGATGTRILATGLRELARRDGRYLLVTMCIGGGQGLAAVFERVRL